MKHMSKRGAARVSAVWLIVVVVLFLASMMFGYTMNDAAAQAEARADRAESDRSVAQQTADDANEKLQAITAKFGFNDQSEIGTTSNPDVAGAALEALGATIPLDAVATTYEAALPQIQSAYSTKLQEIKTLQARVADLENQVTSAQSALADVSSQKDSELGDLRTQITDDARAAQAEKDELESRIATLTSSRNVSENALVDANSTIDDRDRSLEQLAQEHETRQNATRKVLAFTREPDRPDGEILATSPTVNRGWINLGAQDRIHRGIRFTVISGGPDSYDKGWCEVVSVDEKKSEVKFYNVVDPFDPIVQGDIIYNKLYDSRGRRNAVLVGRFTGTYNESELRMLLDQIGMHVQAHIDSETDYLVVGEELWFDEDGEPLEDPIQPSDLPEYRQAEAIGVQMVSLRDVERYFKK